MQNKPKSNADEFDGYLAKNKQAEPDEFDDYIKRVTTPAGPKHSKAQTALEHYGNAATMGYLPHAQALTEKAADAASGSALKGAGLSALGPLGTMVATLSAMRSGSKGADERLKSRGFQVTQPEATYVGSRDENARRLKLEGEEHPVASGVGTVAGVVGGGLLTAPLAGARAATAGGRILQGAKAGAVMGAAANPGDIEGEVDPVQLDSRIQGAKVGGLIGGSIAGATEALGPLAAKAKDFFTKKANSQALAATGATKKQIQDLGADGQRVGRMMFDEKVLPKLATPGRILNRLESKIESQEGKLTSLISDAESKIGKTEFWDALPVDKQEKLLASMFDPKQTAERLKSELIAKYNQTPLMKLQPALDEIDVWFAERAGLMSPAETQAAKVQMGKFLKDTDFTREVGVAKEGTKYARRGFKEGVEKTADTLADVMGSDGGQIKATNRTLGDMYKTQKMATGGTARTDSNRTFGLTDTIAAATTAASKGPAWGIMAAALNKTGRTFGAGLQAHAADAASKLFGTAPSLVAFARNNPMLASAIAGRIAQPGGIESPHFKELEDPQVLSLFKANPQLIDSVQDPKLKAAILKRLGMTTPTVNRVPAQPQVNAVTGPTGK